MQNDLLKGLYGRLCDECLNEESFISPAHAARARFIAAEPQHSKKTVANGTGRAPLLAPEHLLGQTHCYPP